MSIKQITCRLHNTEWSLVRLEQHDFKNVSRLGIVGHPAYWHPHPPDEDVGAATYGNICDGYFDVWPLPAEGVEVIPVYEDSFTV